MRNTVVNCLFELAKKDSGLFVVTGDLGYGVLTPFWKELPEQIINAGISEQNMISVASGMALEGKKVFIYSIGNFPTMRCLEQIRNDAAYHGLNVKIMTVGGGFVYGQLGVSHHATEDLAIMRAIPGMSVFAPGDPMEAVAAVKMAYETEGPFYIRMGKGGEKNIRQELTSPDITKAQEIKHGNSVAVISTGAILDEVMSADEELTKEGIHVSIYSFPMIKPIDTESLLSIAASHSLIVTVEEHNLSGGFGSAVAEVFADTGIKTKLKRIGIADTFAKVTGSQKYLRDLENINAKSIADCVRCENVN